MRFPVKSDVTDGNRDSGLCPHPGKLGLQPETGQPVGEETDRLIVTEVGLTHPSQRLGTGHDESVLVRADGEVGLIDRTGTQNDPRGGVRRHGCPVCGNLFGQGE